MKKSLQSLSAAITTFLLSVQIASAQPTGITNPIFTKQSNPAAAEDGSLFVYYLVLFWNVLITVGGLATLYFFASGALDWVTSSGDKGKLETARGKMINAFLGMLILASSFMLVGFVGFLLGIDLLKPTFLTAGP